MDSRLVKTRDYSLDNIRFFLIFAVVFGHLLEVCEPFAAGSHLYRIIYSFHMPAFIFLFGYNVRFAPKRILCRWCIPYIVCQSGCIMFEKLILKSDMQFQFSTPYWLLWYMLACIFYQLILPLYETTNKRRQIAAVLCAFVISFIIGFDDSVGYYMSLSRFFVFQPWFLLGCYCKKNGIAEQLQAKRNIRLIVLFVSVAIIVLSIPLLGRLKIPETLLYGACSYSISGGTLWMRVLLSATALAWILFLFVGIKPYLNRNLALITRIGQNTWPVFLLHGVFVKTMPNILPWLVSSPVWAILPACAILVLLGNKIFNKVVYYLCFSWLEERL